MAHPDQREMPLTGQVLPAEVPQDKAIVAEIDRQVATARKYPRSVKAFMDEALSLATLNEDVAASCFYKLPRAGKSIEGPSVRLAEIIASTWGHMRAETRVVEETDRFVTSRATAFDLQRNVAIAFEVRRRITNRDGVRFNDDMITQTANAGNAIALRNAVFRVVPKAFWEPIYEAAKKAAVGNLKTLADRRGIMLDRFAKLGVPAQRIFETLKVKGIEDITLEHLEVLVGAYTAIKDGDAQIDDVFPPPAADAPSEDEGKERTGALSTLKERLRTKNDKKPTPPPPPDVDTKTGEVKKPEPAPAPQPEPAGDDKTDPGPLTESEAQLRDALNFGDDAAQEPAKPEPKKGGRK